MKQITHLSSFSVAAIAAVISLAIPSVVKCQTLEWTRQLGTSSDDLAVGASADGLGNFYVTGLTYGNLGGTNAGSYDAFVSRYDSAGTFKWTRQLGTSGRDRSWGVSPDGLGNVYIFGDTFGNLGGTSAGGYDTFISKYDEGGNLQWTRQYGTSNFDFSLGSSADALGNLYTLSYILNNQTGNTIGNVVSKYDSAGNLQWTRPFGTYTFTGGDYPHDISADGLGNVYITGETNGNLGGMNAGDYDAFVMKYNSAGTLQWTRQLGSSARDGSTGVSADSLGNIYIAGSTNGDLGGTNSGGDHGFVSKYDSAGTLQWTRQSADHGGDASADGLGNVYLLGETAGSLGGPNAGGHDAFVIKYDSAGTVQWTRQFGTSENDGIVASSADGLGHLYVAGNIRSPNTNSVDVWVAKLSDSAVPEPSTLLLAALAIVPLAGRRRGVRSRATGPRAANIRFASQLIAIVSLLIAAPAQAQPLFRLTPADAATNTDFSFGTAVALSDKFALVGNSMSNLTTGPPGSAYVFDLTTGQQLSKLTPTDSVVADKFGQSVALSGNFALVGSENPFANGGVGGAAYIFDAATGQQLHKLVPTDSVATSVNAFGVSVALSGTTALVGAPYTGWAYLFDVPTGQLLRKLKAPPGALTFEFGYSVALSGNTALVTHYKDVFVFDITTGAVLRTISLPFYAGHATYGEDIALSGNVGVFGNDQDNHAGTVSGAAHVYDVTTGQQLFKLTASDPAAQDYFGSNVALNGNLALISSPFDDGAHTTSGSAYLYDVTTGQQLAKFTSPDDVIGSRFAYSVALNGNMALIGGSFIDGAGFRHAAVYLFDVTVPEPSTLLLAALALVPMTMRGRRVRKSACSRDIARRLASLSIPMHSVRS